MNYYRNEYTSKLKTAEEAVKVIRDNDWIAYGEFAAFTPKLDRALAERKDELNSVHIRACGLGDKCEVISSDPHGEVFDINDRFPFYKDKCFTLPVNFGEINRRADVAFLAVRPMDDNGFFNLSLSQLPADNCDYIIAEINYSLPFCCGAEAVSIHISEIDAVVDGGASGLKTYKNPNPNSTDEFTAQNILGELEDRCCLEVGFGSIPEKTAELIAESDIINLGVHSDIIQDSIMELYKRGKITNRYKQVNKGKMVYSYAAGSDELYGFLDRNEAAYKFPAAYTNDPFIIAENDKVFSINQCSQVDLFSQISVDSCQNGCVYGLGGMWDFTYGAFRSNGGKGIICLNSVSEKTDSEGNIKKASNIKAVLPSGATVGISKNFSYYIATEYGCRNLKGLSVWEKAEAVIMLSHPDFREGLIKDAGRLKIWRQSNKR